MMTMGFDTLMLTFLSLSSLHVAVRSTPIAFWGGHPRSTTVAPMAASQIATYQVPAMFARAAYCPSNATATWSCGPNCDVVPGFVPYGAGGDGNTQQYWFVGYDPIHLNAIVVGHQGTNPSQFIADLTDANLYFTRFNSTLFPGLDSRIQGHNGFLNEHELSAPAVLAAVRAAQAATGNMNIVLVGHSLGAALALLDSVYLPLHLPGSSFTTVTMGMPRVGNQAFADYVDAHVTNLAHITNLKDPIPILPGRFLGYAHPSGEKHIVVNGSAAGDWVACAGQDNTNSECSTGAVPTVFSSSLSDHDGPYDGIVMSSNC